MVYHSGLDNRVSVGNGVAQVYVKLYGNHVAGVFQHDGHGDCLARAAGQVGGNADYVAAEGRSEEQGPEQEGVGNMALHKFLVFRVEVLG